MWRCITTSFRDVSAMTRRAEKVMNESGIAALAALLLSGTALGQAPSPGEAAAADRAAPAASARSEPLALRRPQGPVTVTADRAEWQQGGVMLYTGNVRLSSDTLEMSGARMEIERVASGQFRAKLDGEPARLSDPGAPATASAPASPPITAEARQLIYDAAEATVELKGGALLTRGPDRLTGESIHYDVAARRVQALGGEGGQVRIVITPPADKNNPAAPAPAMTEPRQAQTP